MPVLVFTVSVVCCLLVTPAVIRYAESRALLDLPSGGRRVHTMAVPRLGGLAILVSTLAGLSFATWFGFRRGDVPEVGGFVTGIVAGGGLLALVGVIDDIYGVSPRAKLAAQVLAGCALYTAGVQIDSFSLSGGRGIELGYLALPITVLWVVLVTNALNLIDGLDGLAAGIAGIALVSLMAVATIVGRPEVVIIAAALLGALVGFLRYNFRPARIFLGDSGSLFVGFTLAALAIAATADGPHGMVGLVPLFALALPLVDTSLSFGRRWLRGASVADADRRHIHHQLLARGIPHLRAVVTLYIVACSAAMVGLLVAIAPPTIVATIAISGGALALSIILWGLGYLSYHEFAEAAWVIAGAPKRFRKVLRDQIHARDVASVIRTAESLDEVNAILADNASNLEYLDLTVCRESQMVHRHLETPKGLRAYPPKVEFPVHVADGAEPIVLRIWCNPDLSRPYGAERVAHVLVPVIAEWLSNHYSREKNSVMSEDAALSSPDVNSSRIRGQYAHSQVANEL